MLKTPAKASVWYIASGGIARAIGALSTPIFTRLLTPEEYGLYPLYTTWMGVLSVLVTLELTGNAIYRGFQKHSDKKDEFTTAALGLLGSVFFIFCALYFAFYGILESLVGLSLKNSILMLAEIFTASIISLYLARARYEYKYKAVAALNLLSAVAIPLLAIVFILLFGIRAESRIYASALVSLLSASSVAVVIIRGSEKLYSRKIWGYLLKHSVPLIPQYFAAALILKSFEISIERTGGTEALGKYSVAMSVGMALTVVTGGLLSALAPWILRKLRDGSIDRIRDFLYHVTRSLALVSLLILSAAPELIAFLAAEEFRSALPAVYPLEIAAIFSFLSGAILSGCAYYEKGAFSSIPSIAAALISVSLSIFALPKTDYRFAGVFALSCYLIMTLISALVFRRLSGEYPIDLKKCALIFLLTAAYATLLFAFRGVFISRMFLAIPILILLLISSKEIYRRVKE